jgi:hypothetical protein
MPSRQNVWQRSNQAKGLCRLCTEPRDPKSKSFCTKHMLANRKRAREWARKKHGYKARRKNGVGRPLKK